MFPYPLVAPSVNHDKLIAAELLEPAIDGPPSPESIRAISNQMRRASGIDRQKNRQSHQTTSSGSSSLRSQNSLERPSWDHAFDTATSSLSRQSSGRSISSGQLRERHDSVQIFSRSLFAKRTKLHRESTTQSSSSSSLHSAEIPLEATSSIPPMPPPPKTSHGLPTSSSFGLAGAAPSKDSSKHSFFSRRRATRSGPMAEELEARRKFQISGPYNFQHVTHTEKEEMPPPNLRRGSRMFVPSDFTSAPLSQIPADSPLRAIHSEAPLAAGYPAEAMSTADNTVLPTPVQPFTRRPHAASVSAVPLRPRTLFHTLSQDQLCIPPPRPPRSPIESSFSPPVPPPRMSSRTSIRYGDFDPLATTTIDRPQTSGSFRSPAPLVLPPDVPPRLTHAHSFSADMNVKTMDFRRMAQVLASPSATPSQAPPSIDENNWPLACSTLTSTTTSTTFEILPGVPEEEEHTNNRASVRKSHMSVASNSSSLRGCQSLPVLRRMLQRPPSDVSDTLGEFDLLAAQRALQDSMSDSESVSFLPKESWEDAIDYCYEHAVEADCDYVWERPSLDGLSRDDILADLQCSSSNSSSTQKDEDNMLSVPVSSPTNFDVPFLSPASQTSMASLNEVVTPTGLAMRRPGLAIETNPSEEALPTPRYLHVRSSSHASSFKESHGFNLSPTFFIPGSERYDQHRLAPLTQLGFAIGADEDEDGFPKYVDSAPDMKHPSGFFASSRASASTTGSRESRDSVLSDRHISATSTATDLTRLTMSTSSIEDLVAKPETEIPQTP